ncbi:MAG: helix-turn-helix domain-containing protein [Pirellulales bacterium]|nr:helix-turn-helix domain-containing protein [Pirellulales bacterium]
MARHGLLKRRCPDTLYNWMNIYEESGIEGLLSRRHGGYHRRPF